MKEQIELILDRYYDFNRPEIKDLHLLEESPELGILCIRWREDAGTITIKAIFQDNKILLTELK